MKNYLVLCNFAGYVEDDYELFTNQWTVGSFDTLEECYEACRQDALQVAKDAYEGMYDEDEQEELQDKLDDFMEELVKVHREEVDLLFFERILISYLEYTDSNGPQHLDYSIMKLK